jgi:hypothetical protein
MPGMSLKTGLQVGGSYTPLTPASSMSPSSRSTIAQQAYGIAGAGVGGVGPRTAAYGSVGIGMAAVAALTFLWWSLPR